MEEISDLEALPYEIFEHMSKFLPDEDVLHLCQTNKNISGYCNQSFWAYRALSKGYIKNIYEFGTKEQWPENNYGEKTPQERYLQLLSEVHCVPGSEKYVRNWHFKCPYNLGKKGDIKAINYFIDNAKLLYQNYRYNLDYADYINGNHIYNVIRNYALYGASRKGNNEVVEYLVSQGNIDLDNALSKAAAGGHIKTVKYLVSEGAIRVDWALVSAAKKGYLNIVKYLISVGASDDYSLNSALYAAAKKGHIETVKYLISLGATNINLALHKAIKNRHIEVVQFLENLVDDNLD